MKKIMYIHGFQSSGASGTVMMLRQKFYNEATASPENAWQQYLPDATATEEVVVVAPDVPVMPLEAIDFLRQYAEQEQPDLIVGTSMGGMYAEQLKGYPRILVNPSFHMAKLLTFRGMGRYPFMNKREDGEKDFKVDKEMIRQFKELEKQCLSPSAEEKSLVWGLFGKDDPTVHTGPEFLKAYGDAHYRMFEGEHRLNDKILDKVVLPLIREILGL